MFPIFFKHEKPLNLFVFNENGVQYKMPLFLMLGLKRWLRQFIHVQSENPINLWITTLQENDLKEIVIN